jgi:MFS family permease
MLWAAHMSGMSTVFPSLARELGSDAARGQWILTAYTLTLSGFLLMFGSIADRIGLKSSCRVAGNVPTKSGR